MWHTGNKSIHKACCFLWSLRALFSFVVQVKFYCSLCWQINTKISNTAPDLIIDQKPQSAQQSSRGGLLLVAGVATVALGAFLVHRAWHSTWPIKDMEERDPSTWQGDRRSQMVDSGLCLLLLKDGCSTLKKKSTVDWQILPLCLWGWLFFIFGRCKFITTVKSWRVLVTVVQNASCDSVNYSFTRNEPTRTWPPFSIHHS